MLNPVEQNYEPAAGDYGRSNGQQECRELSVPDDRRLKNAVVGV